MIALLKCHCRFANQIEGKFETRTSCNSLGPLGAQNKDLSAALKMSLTVVRLYLQCMLHSFMNINNIAQWS